MRRSFLGLLTGVVVLAFAASAQAELVYFLRPVYNDPNCASDPNSPSYGASNDYTQGNYTPLFRTSGLHFL